MNSETQALIDELNHKVHIYEKILGYYRDRPPEINMWPSLLKRAVQKIEELDKEVNVLRKDGFHSQPLRKENK